MVSPSCLHKFPGLPKSPPKAVEEGVMRWGSVSINDCHRRNWEASRTASCRQSAGPSIATDVDDKAKEGASNAVHPSKEVHEIVCPLRFPLRTKRWENISCGIVRIPI